MKLQDDVYRTPRVRMAAAAAATAAGRARLRERIRDEVCASPDSAASDGRKEEVFWWLLLF